MSGVIMEDGTQWERCNQCGAWVRIQDLCYEYPSPEFTCGRDLCNKCCGCKP